MRWLIHGELSDAVASALVRHGHQAHTLADAGIPANDPQELLNEAHRRQLDIVTSDSTLLSAALEKASQFRRSMVLLQVERGDEAQDDAIERLFERYKRLTPGRLYTITGTRVKVRQLPGSD